MLRRFVSLETISPENNLYHYTKCGGVQGILAGRSFRATKSDFLNDTNEMQYILSVVRTVIMEIGNPQWQKLLLEQIVDTAKEIKKHAHYIVSFSTEPDSITLWAEFGEHTGYNIGFRSGQLLEQIEESCPIAYHGYVIYSGREQRRILRDLLFTEIPKALDSDFETILEERMKYPESRAFRKLCRSLQKALTVYALFFKQEEFAAEQEYRLVFREEAKTEVHFREKDGFLLPYLWVGVSGGKKRFPVESITVAPKNHVDLAREGMKLYLKHLGYEIPVGLSKIKLRY